MSKDLNEYMVTLARLAISAKIYCDEQMKQAESGILQIEEMAQAENILHSVNDLITHIDVQVGLVSSRTPSDWKDVLGEIKELLNEREAQTEESNDQ